MQIKVATLVKMNTRCKNGVRPYKTTMHLHGGCPNSSFHIKYTRMSDNLCMLLQRRPSMYGFFDWEALSPSPACARSGPWAACTCASSRAEKGQKPQGSHGDDLRVGYHLKGGIGIPIMSTPQVKMHTHVSNLTSSGNTNYAPKGDL